MEAEFVACSVAVQESVWLRRFLNDLGVVANSGRPVTIYCDSQAAIAYTRDPKYHSKTKHIDTRYNFVRDIIGKNEVTVKYISTHSMVADPLTKPITCGPFVRHVEAMGLRRL